MSHQSEVSRRIIGPLDKRKITTRCQPCAKQRVKVWNFWYFLQLDESAYTMSSVMAATLVQDASGRRKHVFHKKLSIRN